MQPLTVRISDSCTSIITVRELTMGAIRYLYRPQGARDNEERFATPIEIRSAQHPDVMFQVTQDGYEAMLLKANALEAWQTTRRLNADY